jgi:hypothetical protein
MTAFSSEEANHTADGEPKTITYHSHILKSPDWDGTTFCAPDDGVYLFSMSFVRDHQKPDDGTQIGTSDDTRIDLFVNGEKKAGAWAGESSGSRQTGAATVAIALSRGDVVTTRDWADGNKFRRLGNCIFTGCRLAQSRAGRTRIRSRRALLLRERQNSTRGSA